VRLNRDLAGVLASGSGLGDKDMFGCVEGDRGGGWELAGVRGAGPRTAALGNGDLVGVKGYTSRKKRPVR
jgi:hypothetical protein